MLPSRLVRWYLRVTLDVHSDALDKKNEHLTVRCTAALPRHTIPPHALNARAACSLRAVSSDEDDVDMGGGADGAPAKGMSKSLGLRMQKKLMGMTVKSKEAAKNFIDDDMGERERAARAPAQPTHKTPVTPSYIPCIHALSQHPLTHSPIHSLTMTGVREGCASSFHDQSHTPTDHTPCQ